MRKKLEIIQVLTGVLVIVSRVAYIFLKNNMLLYVSFICAFLGMIIVLVYFILYKEMYLRGRYFRGILAYAVAFIFAFLLIFIIYELISGQFNINDWMSLKN